MDKGLFLFKHYGQLTSLADAHMVPLNISNLYGKDRDEKWNNKEHITHYVQHNGDRKSLYDKW